MTDDQFEELKASIPDEVITIPRTKSGVVSLTRKGIFMMASQGWSVRDISKTFGVDESTIQKNFEVETSAGRASVSSRLKTQLIRQALANDPKPALLIFACKALSGLTEEGLREEVAATPEGSTVEFTVRVPKSAVRAGLSELKSIEDSE